MKAMQSLNFYKIVRFMVYGVYARVLHVTFSPLRERLLRIAGAKIGQDTVIFDVRFSNLWHYGFRTKTSPIP